MNLIKLLTLSCLFVSLLSCGSDDVDGIVELPSQSWTIKLNGENFTVNNSKLVATYSSFSGDLVISGTKSSSTEERIVLTFSVENGAPFVDGQSLDLKEGSGNSVLYFDSQGNKYSSLFLESSGTFAVGQYIETDSRNFLSGSVNGVLFNKDDGTSVTVTGSVAAKTYN